MKVLKAEVRKALLEMKSYYPDHIVDIVVKYFLFLGFVIGFGKKAISIDEFYVGYAFWMIASYIISEASVSISFEKQVGTIEQLFIKPTSSEIILLVRTFLMFLISFIKFGILYMIVIITMQYRILIPWQTILIFMISIIGFAGLGIALSGITMIFTKTASFESIISYGLLLVSGAIIPYANMPTMFDKISWIPYIFQISLAQKVAIGSVVTPIEVMYLILSNVLLLVIGLLIYSVTYRAVRKSGVMNRY
ncbi:MAG: ABC transporter permease [Lachnospiraceae bacterium]|nr:ABC transporter permease [Lachnospiraceae bacterium]